MQHPQEETIKLRRRRKNQTLQILQKSYEHSVNLMGSVMLQLLKTRDQLGSWFTLKKEKNIFLFSFHFFIKNL